ncbi:MAG: cytochrome D ubiquinol oxidase subunit II, partial [Cyanobacteria bacterium J06636_27]
MTSNDFYTSEHLQADIVELIERIPRLKNGKYIEQALNTVLRLSQEEEIDRLDWKILSSSLAD